MVLELKFKQNEFLNKGFKTKGHVGNKSLFRTLYSTSRYASTVPYLPYIIPAEVRCCT